MGTQDNQSPPGWLGQGQKANSWVRYTNKYFYQNLNCMTLYLSSIQAEPDTFVVNCVLFSNFCLKSAGKFLEFASFYQSVLRLEGSLLISEAIEVCQLASPGWARPCVRGDILRGQLVSHSAVCNTFLAATSCWLAQKIGFFFTS